MNRVCSRVMLAVASAIAFQAIAGEPPDFFSEHPGKVEIRVSEESLRSLRLNSRRYVAVQVAALGREWRDASMHLKGSGTFQMIDEKPSLTIDVRGAKIHFNNSAEDPGSLNEFIGAYLFKAAQMPVPKVAHAIVILNRRRLGLYVVKEAFASPSAKLPETDITSWEELGRLVDVNSFCAFMAMEVMICHWDGYSLRGNNFHVSRDARTSRFVFEAAGMDQLFGKADFNWKPDMTGRFASAAMSFPEGRELYEKKFRELFKSVFNVKRLCRMVETRVEELGPILEMSELHRLREESAELCARISARHDHLENQLAK
jgi:hypothetical protein